MAELVIPTREGFEVVEQISETRTGKEWNKVEGLRCGCIKDDEVRTLYTLKKTGRVLTNLELVFVEPLSVGSILSKVGEFVIYPYAYNGISKREDFPFVSVGNPLSNSLDGLKPSMYSTYLANFYREKK